MSFDREWTVGKEKQPQEVVEGVGYEAGDDYDHENRSRIHHG